MNCAIINKNRGCKNESFLQPQQIFNNVTNSVYHPINVMSIALSECLSYVHKNLCFAYRFYVNFIQICVLKNIIFSDII